MENNNVLNDRKLHNRGINQKQVENPLVCPYPRKYFAYINDGLHEFCCGVFSCYSDFDRWLCGLSLDDLLINGVQYSKDQIRFINVCRLG